MVMCLRGTVPPE